MHRRLLPKKGRGAGAGGESSLLLCLSMCVVHWPCCLTIHITTPHTNADYPLR